MNVDLFLDAAVNGVPLLFAVWGLVQLFKLFKTSEGEPLFNGNTLLLISFFWGLALGCGYMLFVNPPPAGGEAWGLYAYWFGVVVYGVSLGVLASVFWDALKLIVEKAIAKMVEKANK